MARNVCAKLTKLTSLCSRPTHTIAIKSTRRPHGITAIFGDKVCRTFSERYILQTIGSLKQNADDPQPIADNPSTARKKTPRRAFEFFNQMLEPNPIQSDRYYCDYYAPNTFPATSQEQSIHTPPKPSQDLQRQEREHRRLGCTKLRGYTPLPSHRHDSL